MRRITFVRLPDPFDTGDKNKLWDLLVNEEGIVKAVHRMNADNSRTGENWNGDWLSPRAIDLQINGGLGLAFPELTFKDIPKLTDLLDRLWLEGVEGICPTFVSCEVASLREALAVLREARKQHNSKRCQLLGAHLEGPFIASSRHGAHHLKCICPPSLAALNARIGGYEDEIALVTLAPELDGSEEVIRCLKSLGVVVSLGHSDADKEVSQLAFSRGVSMLTHTFNAMPGLQHRDPGPISQAIANGEIFMGLIADGIHVHPQMATLLTRLAAQNVVLVSDALPPYGLKEGIYQWDKRFITVDQGICRLDDGTLAGITLPLLDTCRKLTSWTKAPSSAIWSATMAPRWALGEKLQPEEYLVGKFLKDLLRWKCNFDDFELSWRQAD